MPKKLEKINREEKIGLMFDLINSFSIVRKPVETALFLQDLLTANEIKNLSKRLRIAKLLMSGITQREAANEADVSLATVNKVANWISEGGVGLKSVVEKLPRKWKVPDNLPPGPIEYHLPQTIAKIAIYAKSKSQEKPVKELLEKMEVKRSIDKNLRKETDEYYKLKNR